MSPKNWGPPIWTLFHTLADKVKEDKFDVIGKQIFHFIRMICYNLPCPECTQHATNFLRKVDVNKINSKKALQDLLYVFHNVVNKRKNKVLLKYSDFDDTYKDKRVIPAFNAFITAYSTDGNMKLMTDNFHRKRLVADFKRWLILNIMNFDV